MTLPYEKATSGEKALGEIQKLLRGTKLPAPCVVRLATDNPIVPPRRCCAPSAFLCDWQLADGRTCDAPLCADHATEVGKDRHYCQRHLAEAQGPKAA